MRRHADTIHETRLYAKLRYDYCNCDEIEEDIQINECYLFVAKYQFTLLTLLGFSFKLCLTNHIGMSSNWEGASLVNI